MTREARGRGWIAALACVCGSSVALVDSPPRWLDADRSPLGHTWSLELRARAFADAGGPAVGVHVPPGFDAGRRPAIVLYFHGWSGCVGAALGAEDTPCVDGGPDRPASSLAAQLDASGVNAMLVAIELRPDVASGDPGDLAQPGRVRALLEELFSEHLAVPLGRVLDVDALGETVVLAHSGGYQAAAATVTSGGIRVDDVVLLDALYGADDVFGSAVRGGARLVDLYTCCGGTGDHSRALARDLAAALPDVDVAIDDGNADLDATTLTHTVFFKRVPVAHADVPHSYARVVFEALLSHVRITEHEYVAMRPI